MTSLLVSFPIAVACDPAQRTSTPKRDPSVPVGERYALSEPQVHSSAQSDGAATVAPTEQIVGTNVPAEFSAIVSPAFVLQELVRLSHLNTLRHYPLPDSELPGYGFALPTSGQPGGEDFVFVVMVKEGTPSQSNEQSQVGRDREFLRAGHCLVELEELPYSFGPGGAFRGIAFTTHDSKFRIELSLIERLKETKVNPAFSIRVLARRVLGRYCADHDAQKPGVASPERRLSTGADSSTDSDAEKQP